jgi:LuxR family maltose regulon positive regulatory protein
MRLTEAWSYYMQAAADLHMGKLEAAARGFARAADLRYVLEPMASVDALAGLALTQQLLGLNDEAQATASLLQEFAQGLNERHFLTVAHSCRARLALLRGDLESAVEWVRSMSESPTPSWLFMWLEAPSITSARVMIAVGSGESLEQASESLCTIRRLSESCRFTNQTIEVAVLQSLGLAKQGRADEALSVLKEAVVLAEPGGWIRPFIELGHPTADLLRASLKQDVPVGYVRRILGAFGKDDRTTRPPDAGEKPRVSQAVRPDALTDPLTSREEEVLELLAQRLSDKDIAARLIVSHHTARSHVRHVLEKLHASNRRDAVTRAVALGILTRR